MRRLARARLINTLERDALLAAREHLLVLRDRLALLGFTSEVVPENPDKLKSLAVACGFENGNAFLSKHESTVQSVRAIYEEGIQRLRS